MLDVIERGAGVPEAERERVFAPFHRLGARAARPGLGLSLVRQIARLHGGDAVVAPRADAPSCFRVSLPAAESSRLNDGIARAANSLSRLRRGLG